MRRILDAKTRIRAIVATIALLASVLLGLALTPGAAQANCSGTTELTGSLYVNGFVYGSEQPVAGTCNGNSYYQTYIQSSYPGWRTSLHEQDGGTWRHYYGGYDTSKYYVEYSDTNSHSEINICVDNGTNWYCGWGQQYTFDTKWTDYYSHILTGF